MTIGLILLVIVFWIAINYHCACAFDAMELTLLYLQCVALSLNYDVNWPENLLVIKHWISIFVFEVAHSPNPTTYSFLRPFLSVSHAPPLTQKCKPVIYLLALRSLSMLQRPGNRYRFLRGSRVSW